MTSFEAYKLFLTLKAHFTSTYDFFKYKGQMGNLTPQSLEARKDRHFFYKLSKHPDPQGLIIANLLNNDSIWITEIFSDECQTIYKAWKKRQESITYTIKQEINNFKDPFLANFISENHDHPHLLKEYINDNVSIDTLVILEDMVNYSRFWDKKMKDDPIWDMTSKKIKKYKPFMSYDHDRLKNIFTERFL